jgi:hypothetical protein
MFWLAWQLLGAVLMLAGIVVIVVTILVGIAVIVVTAAWVIVKVRESKLAVMALAVAFEIGLFALTLSVLFHARHRH